MVIIHVSIQTDTKARIYGPGDAVQHQKASGFQVWGRHIGEKKRDNTKFPFFIQKWGKLPLSCTFFAV